MPFNIYGQRPNTPPVPPDPLTLGTIEWHRADAVTFSSGALIDTWIDLSGNSRTKVLSTGNVNTRATQLPTSAPNSQPSASAPNPFAGNTTGYDGTFGYALQTPGGAFSIFAVLKPDAAVDGDAIYRFAYSQNSVGASNGFNGASTWWTPFDSPNQMRMNLWDNGSPNGGGGEALLSPGSWAYLLYCCDWNLGITKMYLNGTLVQSNTVGNPATPLLFTQSMLLRNYGGGHALNNFSSWFGEVAEHAIFATSLETDGTVSLLTDYVRTRYGTSIAP